MDMRRFCRTCRKACDSSKDGCSLSREAIATMIDRDFDFSSSRCLSPNRRQRMPQAVIRSDTEGFRRRQGGEKRPRRGRSGRDRDSARVPAKSQHEAIRKLVRDAVAALPAGRRSRSARRSSRAVQRGVKSCPASRTSSPSRREKAGSASDDRSESGACAGPPRAQVGVLDADIYPRTDVSPAAPIEGRQDARAARSVWRGCRSAS